MQPFDSHHANQVAALLAVCDAGSFAGAGDLLQRHPTVMSKRIIELESRLGVRLLERNTRTLRFTEAGLLYVKRMRTARDAIIDAEHEIAMHANAPTGTLRLALPGAFGRQWLAPLIARFAMQHAALQVHAEYSDRYVDILGEGYDAAIRVGALQDSRLQATRLCGHDRILAAAPAYVERHGMPLTPSELGRHRCLAFTGLHSHPFWHLQKGGKTEQIKIAATLTSNDNQALLSAALAGAGIMAGGEWLSSAQIANGELLRVLPEWRLDARSAIYFVRPSKTHAAAKTRIFKAWIEAQFSPQAPWLRPGGGFDTMA